MDNRVTSMFKINFISENSSFLLINVNVRFNLKISRMVVLGLLVLAISDINFNAKSNHVYTVILLVVH